MNKFLLITIFIFLIMACAPIDKDKHYSLNSVKHNLPIISLVAKKDDLFSDNKGIYVKGIGLGEDWAGNKANYLSENKIEAHFRYFDRDSQVVSKFINMKVSGGGSRGLPQKSFNIYANNNKSKSFFKYAFFKQLHFKHFFSLRIRNSGQDWSSTLFRDVLMHSIVEDLTIDIQASQPVILYLNGKYWGIYNLREKFSRKYLQEHHDFKSDKIDAINKQTEVIYGSISAYEKLLSFIKNNDLSIDSNYNHVTKRIDVQNFIDYYTAQIYFANTDWPSNNVKFWRSKKTKNKWRWFLHDTDMGFGFAPFAVHLGGVNHNTFLHTINHSITPYHNKPSSTFLFRNLLKNNEFQNQFLCVFKYNLENAFSSSRVNILIEQHYNNIKTEMPKHIERWKDSDKENSIPTMEAWYKNIETLKDFSNNRPSIIKKYLMEYFNITEKEWENMNCNK